MCGKVKYEIAVDAGKIVHCHCKKCRKAHASAFSSVVSVPGMAFSITGDKHLKSFESSPGKHRFFCQNCGTQIYSKRDDKENIILRAGSVDSGLESTELAHMWVSEKAGWYEINSSLPTHAENYKKS